MQDDPLMKIKNLRKMSKHIGREIANEMLIPLEEMTQFIKPSEIKSLVKQYSVYSNKEYLINTMGLQKVFTEAKNWILGIQLAKMASANEIEAVWDDEQNCMIFNKRGKNGKKSI